MEIDEELAAKMQRFRAREDELRRERDELRHFARQQLSGIERTIEDLTRKLEDAEAEQDKLRNFLGIATPTQERVGHGVLKELCLEALLDARDGLRSNEVKAWIEKRYPAIRTASVPATLSRQTEQGVLRRDEVGRYVLT